MFARRDAVFGIMLYKNCMPRNTILMTYRTFSTFALFATFAACSAPDDYAGEVTSYNGNFLTISGMMNQKKGVPGFYPTPAMQEKAEATCGGPAKFEGTVDSNPTADSFTNSMFIGYNFICQR